MHGIFSVAYKYKTVSMIFFLAEIAFVLIITDVL